MIPIDTSHQSPNHSSRNGRAIAMLVIHATGGELQSSIDWLCRPASRVSAHYVVARDGRIFQLVPDARAAWHAGVSQWQDLRSADIREISIGIELVNANTGSDPYPDAQYRAVVALSRELIPRYTIAPDMITRHSDIAIPIGRKTDPAGFPWPNYLAAVTDETALWASRWGPIARPDQTSWSWAIPQAWKHYWIELGPCIGAALYDTQNGIVIQPFERGDIRQRAGQPVEVLLRP